MDTLDLLRMNLLSPVVLAFVLGLIAVFVRSDLKFPPEVYAALSIFLLLAIGMKGGLQLAKTPLSDVVKPVAVTLALGIITPLVCYAVCRWFGRLDIVNSAALAAHYGSVSAVTFAASLTYAQMRGMPYEGFMPALVAVLEVPAIVLAMLLARRATPDEGAWGKMLHEVTTGRSVVLLIGGLVIGYVSSEENVARVAPFFFDLFYGMLVLFLLDMGMVAGKRLKEVGRSGYFLVGLGVIVPLINGTLGVLLGILGGLSLGGTAILGVMAASASYIAAPAAVRVALPQANPAYYLTAAIAITFPFNLTLGIPLIFELAIWLHPALK
ncbi:MAG TPA: sodium-dependent bicarbonate transport family permease [Tepidisphaeraceae bacterium]|jgi:hypothetical protein